MTISYFNVNIIIEECIDMSKKIIALFLACGLIFATGCGKKTNDDKKKDDNKGNTLLQNHLLIQMLLL